MADTITLHFGFDDANHCPIDDRNFEVIVGTASLFDKDGLLRAPRKKRSLEFAERWKKDSSRYWVFTILPFSEFRTTSYNLVLVAPELTYRMVEKYDIPSGKINAIFHMDGRIKSDWKNLLKDEMHNLFDSLEIRPYIKGMRYRFKPIYPNAVHAADNIGNSLLKSRMDSLRTNERYVPIDIGQLVKRRDLLEGMDKNRALQSILQQNI